MTMACRSGALARGLVMAMALLSAACWHAACPGMAAGEQSCAADAPSAAAPAFKGCRLQYYVQVLVGDPSLNQNLLPALNASYTGTFGHAELFAFNATKGPQPDSELVGTVRGFTIDTSYIVGSGINLIEVELIAYDDGRYKGTIQIQAQILAAPPSSAGNEVAIVGGTGSFRGARGFGFVARVLLDGNYRRFHHDLYFLW